MSKSCYFRKGETDFERPTDNVQDQRVLLVPPAAQRPPSSQLWGRESQAYLYSGRLGPGQRSRQDPPQGSPGPPPRPRCSAVRTPQARRPGNACPLPRLPPGRNGPRRVFPWRGGRERGGPARRGPRRLLGPRAPQPVLAPPAPAPDEPPAPSHLELPHQPQKLQQVPGPAARQGCSGGRSHATSDPDRAEQAAWLPPEAPPPPLSSSFPSGSSFSPFVSTTSLPWFSQPPLSCLAPSGLGGRPLSIVPSTAETVLVPY